MVSTVSEERVSCGQYSLRKDGFLRSARSQKRGFPAVSTVSEKKVFCGNRGNRIPVTGSDEFCFSEEYSYSILFYSILSFRCSALSAYT